MNRRDFSTALSAALAASLLPACGESGEQSDEPAGPTPPVIAMLVYPEFTTLDLFGPQLIFAAMETSEVHLVWKTRAPVVSDSGVAVLPSLTFADCPDDLDILFVPGGLGTAAIMNDDGVLDFLARKGARSSLVTSVCTGALALGAAGLLRGYRATTHWAYRDLLPIVGAEPVNGRVVEDRNRITAGGVTAGIDFALTIAARLRGDTAAQRIQLAFEYAPDPPFDAGSPETAGEDLVAALRDALAPSVELARQAAVSASQRFNP